MNNFQYYNPVRVVFGVGSLGRLPEILKDRKTLLVTSSGFQSRGVVAKIKSTAPIVQVIDCVQPNPTINHVKELYSQLDFRTFDVIVALGGGSVIDTAKALSIYSEQENFSIVEKILFGERTGMESDIQYKKVIAIPTTAGTGSEVTPWGTIWDDTNKKKYSIHTENLWCETAICDPLLSISLPRNLTIQTGLDALSHSLESIWNKNSNPISRMYAVQAAKTICYSLPKLEKDLQNVEFRAEMMEATLKAGLAFSNTQTAIAHAMSYYMTLHKEIPHGIAASITLPDIVEVAMEDYGEVMNDIFGENPKEQLLQFFRELHVSTSYPSYGLGKDDFDCIRDSLKLTPRANNSTVNIEVLFDNMSKNMF